MPVKWVVQRPDNAVDIQYQEEFLDLIRRDEFRFEVHVAVLGPLCLEKVHTIGIHGNRDATDMVQTARLAADFFKLLVEADCVPLQLGDVGIRVESVKATGSMLGGARRQFRSFDEDDVPPSQLGQVIEHATSDHATIDYDHLRVRPHRFTP